MKHSTLLLSALAISLGCYGCTGDAIESDACGDENCQTETDCKCDDGTDCPKGKKDNCKETQTCKCDDGTDCPKGDKNNCNGAQECKCDDGTDCPKGKKDNCDGAQECKCDDGTDCPNGDKNNCDGPQECKCDDGTDCPNGDKNNCDGPQECKCDDGTDCPNGDKNNCDGAQECKCDDGTDCLNGDKNNCDGAQECKCDDGTDCPNGDKNNCDGAQECKCDDGTDCPNGDKNNCITSSECNGEKPENAIDCQCVDGYWTNCTYPGEPQCAEVCDALKLSKCGSEGVMKCESDSNGCAVWNTIEPCNANSHCDETQLKCVDNCSSPCDVTAPAKCENGKVVTCKKDASGCATYQTTTCEKGTYCDAGKATCVPCKETCSAAKRCSTKGVESCSADAQGCAVWTLTETCPANTSCDATKLKCVDACNSSCNSGEVCDNGKCVCNPKLPEGWPTTLTPLQYPLMIPSKNTNMHGSDNIYAPDIHEVSGQRVMWYGAQGKDGHDRIFMAISSNGAEWRKYPSDSNPQPVLNNGSSNHVNDPSLVHVGGKWKMYYTDAASGEDDLIWLAESSKLTGFVKVQKVLGLGAPGSWESKKVGRPSVLYEDGVYKMWYDGQDGKARHVGLATSTDGVNFTKHPSNPLVLNAGAIDVDKIGGVYVMLMEGQDGTYWATSVDGICWVGRGKLFNRSGADYDKYGQVTPFLEVSDGKLRAVWFGGASVSSWNRNRIGAAYAPGAAPSGGGCTACTSTGLTCTEACQNAGAGTAGYCGNPGSTTAGACCGCSSDGCEKCVVGAKDCHQACVGNGSSSGYCAHPGSTDSSNAVLAWIRLF